MKVIIINISHILWVYTTATGSFPYLILLVLFFLFFLLRVFPFVWLWLLFFGGVGGEREGGVAKRTLKEIG